MPRQKTTLYLESGDYRRLKNWPARRASLRRSSCARRSLSMSPGMMFGDVRAASAVRQQARRPQRASGGVAGGAASPMIIADTGARCSRSSTRPTNITRRCWISSTNGGRVDPSVGDPRRGRLPRRRARGREGAGSLAGRSRVRRLSDRVGNGSGSVRAREIARRHRSLRIGLVDAVVMAIAERLQARPWRRSTCGTLAPWPSRAHHGCSRAIDPSLSLCAAAIRDQGSENHSGSHSGGLPDADQQSSS